MQEDVLQNPVSIRWKGGTERAGSFSSGNVQAPPVSGLRILQTDTAAGAVKRKRFPDKRSRPLHHLLPHLLLIVLCLCVPHFIVFARRILYQLFMTAGLNQGAFVEYRNLFTEAAGGEAV